MKRKSTYLVILTLLLVIGTNSIVFTNSSQPNAGHTGAPGENTCATAGCHSGTATVSTAMDLNTLPQGDLVNGYTPGQQYNLFLNINSLISPASATPKDGFQLTVLTSGGAAAGTLALPNNPATVSLTTGGGKQYIGHKNAASTNSWTFKWTAPAAGTGAVTFYVTANRSNNLSNSSGDNIYKQQFTFAEGAVANPCTNFAASISTPGNATSFCNGQSLALTASSTGGPGGATYNWSNAGGSTATINVTSASTYTVTVTEGTCTATASLAVTSVAAGVANFTATVSNNVVTINNSSTGANGSYTWNFGDGTEQVEDSPSFTYTYDSIGTYTISVAYTDVCGTAQTDDAQVTITTIPTVGVGAVSLANALNIYPNPFGNQTSINITGFNGSNYQFTLVDITGKTVRRIEGVGGTPLAINRDGLQGGMYFYNITVAGQTAQGKLLID